MSFRVEKAEERDVTQLQGRLREDDVREVIAASGRNPDEALARAFRISTHCWTVHRGGDVAAMFGVAPVSVLAGLGSPWLLGSDLIQSMRLYFAKHSRAYVEEMNRAYNYLENYVDVRNIVSIRWLKWCGFQMEEPEIHGVAQIPFIRFHRGERNV